MTDLEQELDRIGGMLKGTIDADLAGRDSARRIGLGPHLRTRRAHVMALTTTTGVAACVSTLLLVGGGQQYAFAGWSSDPTTPSNGNRPSVLACSSPGGPEP